jgi:hypothetical protein
MLDLRLDCIQVVDTLDNRTDGNQPRQDQERNDADDCETQEGGQEWQRLGFVRLREWRPRQLVRAVV